MITDTGKSRLLKVATPTMLLAALPWSTSVALDMAAELQAGVGYSNNIDLQPSGEEQSDGVLRVVPTIYATHESRRLQLDLQASLESLFYRDDDKRNSVNTQASSDLLFELIDDTFAWRGLGSVTQVNVNPNEALASSNIFDTGNRDDQFIWQTGPELTKTLFRANDLAASAYLGQVNYGDSSVQDVDTKIASVTLSRDPERAGKLGYELSYLYQKLDYDESGEVENQNAFLRAGFQYNPALQVFGLVGLDNDFQDPGNSSLDKFRWEAGFASEWANNTFEAAYGERYFGHVLRLSWERQAESSLYRLAYQETPSNSDLLSIEALQTQDPEDPLPPPSSETGRPGVNDRFILNRLDAGAYYELFRSQLSLEGFWENRHRERDAFVQDPGTVSQTGDEESWGGTLSMTWEVGYKTTLGASTGYRHRDQDTYDDTGTPTGNTNDEIWSIRGDLTYALGTKTDLSLYLLYEDRSSSSGGTSTAEYDQFGGFLQLTRRFGEICGVPPWPEC